MRWGALAATSLAVGVGALAAVPARAEGPTVRFATTLGDIDVLLLSDEAPKTVANFLGYVDRGDYVGTFFHRSVSGFIVQGGGFTFPAGQPVAIPQQAPVVNEFHFSNTRGTLAMAKLGGDPNSATNQWFFNESNGNAANLDAQNGGFTVFGRIVDSSGLSVMDAIGAQRIVDASGAFGSTFGELPVVNYPTGNTPAGSNLVSVSSITRVPTPPTTDTTAPTIVSSTPHGNQHFTLGATVTSAYTCDDGAGGSGVATCSAPDTVDTSTLGAHKFVITAWDNASNHATQTVTYYVDPAPPAAPPPATPPSTETTASVTPPAPVPTAPAAPSAPTLSGAVGTSSSGVVTMTLRCGAAQRCAGRLRLVATTRAAHPRRITVALQGYAIAADGTTRVRVRLSAAGRRLLAANHGRLAVAVTITPSGTGATAVQRRLTLIARR